MRLDEFLLALFDHGRVAVPKPRGHESADEIAAAARVLEDFERQWRLEFPGAAPEWRADAAVFGGRLLYRGVQAAVHREIGLDAIRAGLALAAPTAGDSPAAHYCVDLALRFLPGLARMTHAAAADDPLGGVLREIGVRWPLSSVGMRGVEPVVPQAVVADAGLLRLYVDRILAAGDIVRLDDPRVAAAARAAVGGHPELLPAGFGWPSPGIAR